jgi:hypothetical protein
LFSVDGWRNRFAYVAAWIIDSFWIEHIPRAASYSRAFDQLFITTLEDIPSWTSAMGTPTAWLPWGTDALRLGTRGSERSWDLLRVGRQPPEWNDDATTERDCLARSLRFHGRPEYGGSDEDNEKRLMRLYGASKFLLAFSNVINPESYVHKTREYVSARWVDALAGGAVVAGIPPRSPTADSLLWAGATLDLRTAQRDRGLNVIAEAVRSWRPEQAKANALQALEHLDWRWRFSEIAKAFRVAPKRLEQELGLLRQAVEERTKSRES